MDFDPAPAKETGITERVNMEFRAEFFNVLNRLNFGRMNMSLFNPSGAQVGNAGSLVDTINDARQIQFGLKLSF